jgi:hypothetical protein
MSALRALSATTPCKRGGEGCQRSSVLVRGGVVGAVIRRVSHSRPRKKKKNTRSLPAMGVLEGWWVGGWVVAGDGKKARKKNVGGARDDRGDGGRVGGAKRE